MGKTTGISWTHHTFNGVWGCTKVSPACTNCYADNQAASFPNFYDGDRKPLLWGPGSERRVFGDHHWNEPRRWNREAESMRERRRVFAYSMGDWAEDHPIVIAQLPKLHSVIMETPWLDWLLLTKRPERIAQSLPGHWLDNPRHNVWLGTTVESEKYLYRASTLAAIPCVVHFLSIEPMLENIFIPPTLLTQIEWVICGGESGERRRPFDVEWAYCLSLQCACGGVAFYMKQMSARTSPEAARLVPTALQIHQIPKGGVYNREAVAK